VGGQHVTLIRSPGHRAGEPVLLAQPGMERHYPQLVRRFPQVWQVVRLRVPPGHVFVVGDNAPSSIDSRYFGPLPESCIVGRVRPLSRSLFARAS